MIGSLHVSAAEKVLRCLLGGAVSLKRCASVLSQPACPVRLLWAAHSWWKWSERSRTEGCVAIARRSVLDALQVGSCSILLHQVGGSWSRKHGFAIIRHMPGVITQSRICLQGHPMSSVGDCTCPNCSPKRPKA